MSNQEEADARADIFGFRTTFADLGLDSDGLVSVGLKELDPALDAALGVARGSGAYAEARRRCPELVGADHRAAFLWREDFSPDLAAKRIAKYWELRKQVFGDQRCFAPINQQTMEEDAVALSSGMLRILPKKDMFGRAIIVWDSSIGVRFPVNSTLRVWWYHLELLATDKGILERGAVLLGNHRHFQFQRGHPKLLRSLMNMLLKCSPIKICSMHICSPSSIYPVVIFPIVKTILGAAYRKYMMRFLVHGGDDNKIIESLSHFGLTKDRLPPEFGGQLIDDPSLGMNMNSNTSQLETVMRHTIPPDPDQDQEETLEQGVNQVLPDHPVSGQISPTSTGPLDGSEEKTPEKRRNIGQNEKQLSKDNDFATAGKDQFKYAGESGEQPRCNEEEEDRDLSCAKEARSQTASSVWNRITSLHTWQGDPRMDRALAASLENPRLSLQEALRIGGFRYLNLAILHHISEREIFDDEGVSLLARKNQLRQRIQQEKERMNGISNGKVIGGRASLGIKTTQTSEVKATSNVCSDSRLSQISEQLLSRQISLMVAKHNRQNQDQTTQNIESHIGDLFTTENGGQSLYHASKATGAAFFNEGNKTDGTKVKGTTEPKLQPVLQGRWNMGKRPSTQQGDPRMNRAVAARLTNPQLSLLQALRIGGFLYNSSDFRQGMKDKDILDIEGVSLRQRKNQLCRRIRNEKEHASGKKKGKSEE